MNKLLLRSYQQAAIDRLAPSIGNEQKLLLSMPAGSGRTLTIVSALYAYYQATNSKGKTLFISNTINSQQQLREVISDVFGADIKVNSNLNRSKEEYLIAITTLQRIIKDEAYNRLDQSTFEIIVFLDCERQGIYYADNNLHSIIEYFRPITIIGVGYYANYSSQIFGPLTFHYSITQAIKSGVFRSFEVIRFKFDHSPNDSDSIKSQAILSDILESDTFVKTISSTILENIKDDQQTIILCNSILHAQKISNEINRQKNNSKYSQSLSTHNTRQEKEAFIKSYNNTNLHVLVGVNYLLSGVNLRNIDNIVIIRRFGTTDFLLQSISRFLRLQKNTAPLRILDFADNYQSLSELPPAKEYIADVYGSSPNKEKYKKSYIFSKTQLLFATKNKLQGVIGVDDIAEELADTIVNMPCESGCMVGIFGKWGRGKTFLMNETWNVIKRQRERVPHSEPMETPKEIIDFQRIDFHAWKYQDTPAIWAYLYEKFAEAYYTCEKDEKQKTKWFERKISYPWNRFWRIFNLNTVRLGWGNILLYFLLLFSSILWAFSFTFPEKIDFIWKLIASLGLSSVISLVMIFFRYKNPAIQLFKKYYSKPSFVSVLGIQEEVQKELKHLVKAWGRKVKNIKFLLFVDDIDRCTEEKIIQLIDALRIMLDDDLLSQNIVIVSAIDERILKRAIQRKYDKLICSEHNDCNQKNEFVKEYLDKIFLIGLKLGALAPDEMDEFFLELTREDRETSEVPSLEELSQISDSGYFPDDSLYEEETTDSQDDDSPNIDHDENNLTEPSIPFQNNPERTETTSSVPLSNKLSNVEINIFRKTLSSYEDMTPRQIRILYYQYLFAKNLLIRQYTRLSKKNIWIDSEYTPCLIKLIFEINKSQDNNILSVEKIKSQKWKDAKERTYLNEIEISLNDYKMLINVLDVVIGY